MSSNKNDNRILLGVPKMHEEGRQYFPEDGSYTERVTRYHLERGIIEGDRLGAQWTSTPQKVRKAYGKHAGTV